MNILNFAEIYPNENVCHKRVKKSKDQISVICPHCCYNVTSSKIGEKRLDKLFVVSATYTPDFKSKIHDMMDYG